MTVSPADISITIASDESKFPQARKKRLCQMEEAVFCVDVRKCVFEGRKHCRFKVGQDLKHWKYLTHLLFIE
jgi:hypothetical protein